MERDVPSETDGRTARRERGRDAVIDALFSLLADGVASPSTDAIAERSGVSLSSLFRYFENIDDLQRQTIDTYFMRFAGLFEIPEPGESAALAARVKALVEARVELYETIAPIARLARARSIDQPLIEHTLQLTRGRMAEQVRRLFASELEAVTPAVADDLVFLLSSLTSFETWEQFSASGRTRHQLRRAWINGASALLGDRFRGVGRAL